MSRGLSTLVWSGLSRKSFTICFALSGVVHKIVFSIVPESLAF